MRTIKKYSNRRLYDTQASAYINLDALAELIRGGEQVQVVDAKTGEDLTHTVLLQVVLEAQGLRELFPPSFLHRLIRHAQATGPQRALLQQVGVGMQMLEGQMQRFEQQFGWMAAASAPSGAAPSPGPEAADEPDEPEEVSEEHEAAVPEEEASPSPGDDLAALRARLAALEARLGE